MARIGRFVVPDMPHHVTQRGNRRETVFFDEDDYALYRDLLFEACAREGVEVWSYCLMPNHVHLILTPRTPEGLGRAIGKAHRRYSLFINARLRVTGHLFQARFASVVMDEAHLIAATRYVSLNPVRAKLVSRAEDWPWSSVRAHLARRDDGLVTVEPVLARVGDFSALLGRQATDDETFNAVRRAEGSGRPLATAEFVRGLERILGRTIARRAPGRKKRVQSDHENDLPFGV